MAKAAKTNAMRILEKEGVSYTDYHYGGDEFADGVTVAKLIDKPLEQVFKTLVTIGASRDIHVFVIPGSAGIILKASGQSMWGKIYRHVAGKRDYQRYRLYQRRLFSHWNEKKLPLQSSTIPLKRWRR